MGLRRTFAGAVAYVTTRGPGVVAFPGSSFLDLVSLIQHSVKGPVSRSAEPRLDAVSEGAPISLLAVDSAASTKWYETGSTDEDLVQKLVDRMKANEEREQEQAVIDQASNTTGATFLSQRSSQTSLAKAKRDTRKWLTKRDLDHIAEDEVELDELAKKLQRIAAEVARIAKHQLEFGKHLGLPDPTVEQFQINDRVELQVGKNNKNMGRWVKAIITGFATRTNWYKVHIPSAKEGAQDMNMVPAIAMRKDEDAIRESDYEPTAMTYEEGEQAQIQISIGRDAESWVKCTVRTKGQEPGTYNIHVPGAQAGHKDLADVPAKRLRKANATKLFSQYDMDGDGLLTGLEFKIALKEKATNVNFHTIEDMEDDSRALFAAGEPAEVIAWGDAVNGSYIPCTIMSEGDLADSYNIFVPSYSMGFQYMANTPADKLRKVGEHKEAFDQKVSLIPDFVDHEVLSPRGAFRGRWVPCQLKRKAADDTYTVWMPFGVAKGHNTAGKIPASRIRVRKSCGAGYDDIFNGDVPGGDQFGREHNLKDKIEDCAEDCNKRWNCISFEYGTATKVCNLNKVSNPTLPATNDNMFCRRKEIPKAPKLVWKGPLLGQPLEFVMAVGEHAGEWHSCTVTSFGTKPDTYTVNASLDFMGTPGVYANLSDVPIAFLRYDADKTLPSLAEEWQPPQGDEALWVNDTNVTSQDDSRKHQSFLITNKDLKDPGQGLLYRASKELNNTIGSEAYAFWGTYVTGVDEGDGWVRVGNTYLPTVIRGLRVLAPRILGEPGELVQVVRKDGIWVPAVIRSIGDAPNTYNVKMLKGSSGKFLDNLPVGRIRKEISEPRVAAPKTPRAAVTTTTTPPAVAEPVAEVSTTEAPKVENTTTPLTEENFEVFVERFKEKMRENYKEEKARMEKEQRLNATAKEATEFLIDNRLLKHSGPGLAYRFSKRLDDTKGRAALAPWGSYVTGVNEGDGWIRVGEKYLPTTVRDIGVITQKVIGDGGEKVKVNQDDGSWVNGAIRSVGDWPETFNVHVMDNGAGYDLDNFPLRRLLHDLEAPTEHRDGGAASKLPLIPGLEEDEADAPVEDLPLTGDLGQDLPEGVFRPDMTAEVKINAGPRAGSWVRCRVVDRGDITDTYNLYVPSVPRAYREMRNIPSLAMRKIAAPTASEQTAASNESAIERNSIDGEPGESVEVFVRKGAKTGQWVPALLVGPGSVPDSYNIRLPGYYHTHKDVSNVPGNFLRKADLKVEIQEEEEYPTYANGEFVTVIVPTGEDSVRTYNCTVAEQGEFSNTYDVIDAKGVRYPGVHAKYMRKIAVAAPVVETTAAPTQEPVVLNMGSVMGIIAALQSDLMPVMKGLVASKKELKMWKRRAGDWGDGCSAQDRSQFVARLGMMDQASPEQVAASVPQECHISQWNRGAAAVDWDMLRTCISAASQTSTECATCHVKFLIHAAEGCLAKCQPMLVPCSADQAGRICATKAYACLDCLEEPAGALMSCVNFPANHEVSGALQTITKGAKAGTLDIEQVLRGKFSPEQFYHANRLGISSIRTLQLAWKAVMGRQ